MISTTTNGVITASGQSITVPVGPQDQSARIMVTGTHAGITLNFEVSPDGTNWFTTLGGRLDQASIPINVIAVGTNGSNLYQLPVAGMAQVRVRSSAWTSGTMAVRIAISTDPVTTLNTSTTADTELPGSATLADGTTNPSTTTVAALPLQYNGVTWDRWRGGNQSVSNVDTSAARTATGTGTTYINYSGIYLSFYVLVTAVSGTTPTMTVKIQESFDGGSTWRDVDATNLQTASITATGTSKLMAGPGLATTASTSANLVAPRIIRAAWTIGGTSPSFTFATYFGSHA